MLYRRMNLGMAALGLGLLTIPATEAKALCPPIAAPMAPLNLAAGAFTSPMPGQRWRIKITVGAGGAACTMTLRARTAAGFPTPSRETLTFPMGGGSRTTVESYLAIVSLTSNVAPVGEVKVEFELLGIALAGNNAVPLEGGVIVSEESVPKYQMATLSSDGEHLVRVDPAEVLVVGKDVVSAANGIGRGKAAMDTGGIIGKNKSTSVTTTGGQSFMLVEVDPRSP